MSARLEMMAQDYERRALESRAAVNTWRQRGDKARVRAIQADARRYEKEAASIRETIRRNGEAS